MAQYEQEEIIAELDRTIDLIDQELDQMDEEIGSIRGYAPDAAESAADRVEAAREKLEDAKEKLNNTRNLLTEFLESATFAANLYDEKEQNPDPQTISEYEKSYSKAERLKGKLLNWINKSTISIEKARINTEKARSKVKIARIKAKVRSDKEQNKKVRINFTLPETMKNDWRNLADELSISVSQMVRNAMDVYERSVKGLEDSGALESLRNLEKMGDNIDAAGEKLDNFLEKKINRKFDPYTGKPVNIAVSDPLPNNSEEKERKKKRIKGLIMMQKCLPVEKLAQTLSIPENEAENIIYELAAEGIECTFDDGICNFDASQTDNIINILDAVIDKM
ncbi:hypothetical protein [Candidatus Lokiarchaeum ossiferum]|uniref:hypothetical protein n=1 Tax=Candidatus Lokiarchaeum ossiferum TaxID=2951803 RepID=UPI00352D238B